MWGQCCGLEESGLSPSIQKIYSFPRWGGQMDGWLDGCMDVTTIGAPPAPSRSLLCQYSITLSANAPSHMNVSCQRCRALRGLWPLRGLHPRVFFLYKQQKKKKRRKETSLPPKNSNQKRKKSKKQEVRKSLLSLQSYSFLAWVQGEGGRSPSLSPCLRVQQDSVCWVGKGKRSVPQGGWVFAAAVIHSHAWSCATLGLCFLPHPSSSPAPAGLSAPGVWVGSGEPPGVPGTRYQRGAC